MDEATLKIQLDELARDFSERYSFVPITGDRALERLEAQIEAELESRGYDVVKFEWTEGEFGKVANILLAPPEPVEIRMSFKQKDN